jgi:hypothetical protein
MASLIAMIKTSLLALAMRASAAVFSMKRGINLDISAAWPGEMGDPHVIGPKWRKTVGAAAELAALKPASTSCAFRSSHRPSFPTRRWRDATGFRLEGFKRR